MSLYTVLFDLEQVDEFEQSVKPLLLVTDCDYIAYGSATLPVLSENSRVLLWLGDEALSDVLRYATEQRWQVGFIPHPDMNRAYRTFYIPRKIKEAIADIFQVETPISADLMYCNDVLVLGAVMLGNPSTMKPAARMDESVWRKLKNMVLLTSNVSKAHLCPYEMVTAKKASVNTAALGITIVYRSSNSAFTRYVIGETQQDEPTLNAIILAPRSILEVVHLLTRIFFPRRPSGSLPDYLGHITTEKLIINGRKAMEYSIDGKLFNAEQLTVEIKANLLQVLSSHFPEKVSTKEQKESCKVKGLPKGEAVSELTKKSLPWIHHADLEEVKETFVTLSENAQASQSYLVLMVLSTLLATVGLFANSAPVIIGAMILAPLMAPIISLSMGVLRQNAEFIKVSIKTLVTGVLLAIFFGTLLSLSVPLHTINSEISARLSPTLLDLGVAIISGIAAAYASARSEVAKSLAGVAIAVALVPPLAVTGIGLSWLDWQVFSGAFLLFITNLIGIVLAAAATFLIMGFSPFYLAKKGLLVVSLLVVMVSVPLVLSYNTMVKEQNVIYILEGWKVNDIEVREVKVRNGDTLYISAKLISNYPLEAAQIDDVKLKMEALLGEEIQLETISAVVR